MITETVHKQDSLKTGVSYVAETRTFWSQYCQLFLNVFVLSAESTCYVLGKFTHWFWRLISLPVHVRVSLVYTDLSWPWLTFVCNVHHSATCSTSRFQTEVCVFSNGNDNQARSESLWILYMWELCSITPHCIPTQRSNLSTFSY